MVDKGPDVEKEREPGGVAGRRLEVLKKLRVRGETIICAQGEGETLDVNDEKESESH